MSLKDDQSNPSGLSKTVLWLILIVILTILVYLPLMQNGFLKTWDDNRYVIENKYIREINPESVGKMFSVYYDGHYHPLTLLSLSVDYSIGGLNPRLYHLTNLILHLINSILVFVFVYLLFGKRNTITPLLTALCFSIATINVESVAWVSERKNLLYALFFIGSLLSYLKYIKTAKPGYYFLSLLLFLLSILSKSMAISLAITLILVDLFFERKIFSRKVIFEKLPYFILAVVFGIVAVFAQKSSWGEDLSQVDHPIFQRVLFSGSAFILYILKAVIPFKMSGFYPYPELSMINLILFILSTLSAIGIFVLTIYIFRKKPVYAFGLLFFMVNVFLLLKLFEVPAGDYVMADRYAYIPSIGIFLLLASAIHNLMKGNSLMAKAGITIIIVYTLFIMLQTFNRVSVWKDDIAFYSDIISKFSSADVAYTNRGAIRKENRDLSGALSDFNKVIQLGKKDYKSYSNRGAVYLDLGEYSLALSDYQKAIELKPDHPQIAADYGFAQMKTGNFQGAINSFNRSLQLKPRNPEVYVNRGTAYYSAGNFQEAIADYNIAILQKPDYANAYFNRGLANIMLNNLNEAVNDFNSTVKFDPKHAEAWSNMGIAWSRMGNISYAFQCYDQAISIKPTYFEAWLNRGIDKYYSGDYPGAKADLDHSITLNASLGPAYYFRALVRMKNNEQPCDDLKKSLELGFQQAAVLFQNTCH